MPTILACIFFSTCRFEGPGCKAVKSVAIFSMPLLPDSHTNSASSPTRWSGTVFVCDFALEPVLPPA